MMAMSRQAVRQGASLNRVPRLDYLLLLTAIALASLGLVMVASASITLADRDLGQPFYFAIRQAIYVGIGVLLALPVYRVRMALLEQAVPVLLVAALALLLAVLIPGFNLLFMPVMCLIPGQPDQILLGFQYELRPDMLLHVHHAGAADQHEQHQTVLRFRFMYPRLTCASPTTARPARR